MTEDVHDQQGKSEASNDVKGSQVVSGLATGMERTRQNNPNSLEREATSFISVRSQES